jgi:hypothetical protein
VAFVASAEVIFIVHTFVIFELCLAFVVKEGVWAFRVFHRGELGIVASWVVALDGLGEAFSFTILDRASIASWDNGILV